MILPARLIVLDTNVLVSALLVAESFPAQVITLARNRSVQTRYSDAILAEYRTVLSRSKFNFQEEDIQKIINGIIRSGIPVNASLSTVPMPDESDRKFYDVAKDSGAMLITGNTKHYPDEQFILTPAAFVQKYYSMKSLFPHKLDTQKQA